MSSHDSVSDELVDEVKVDPEKVGYDDHHHHHHHHEHFHKASVEAEKVLGQGGGDAVYFQSGGLFRRATRGPTFDNDNLSSRYVKPIETFEGLHRWDPDFEWEPKEEQRLVRKINWRICLWVCIAFFSLQLDRGNISQALSDNLLKDLGLSTNQYNTGQSIFYVCFLFAELPSQLISKKVGPDNWIPIQMVSWSLVASCQAFMKNAGGFYACRAFLGLIEGGFIPDNILYLSYWYTGAELPIRLAFFWIAYQATSIVSAFLAYGILHLAGYDGLEGWRWLFALEGTLTGVIGIITYFYLPPSPYQTASRFRGKNGWFTEREEKIMANRILRDDPSKGTMHNRQGLSLKMLWECLKDYHMWPIYLLGLSWLLPTVPMQQYITLNLRAVGFGTFQTNLLTIPAYVIFIIMLIIFCFATEYFNERFLIASLSQVWSFALLLALETLPPSRSPWVTWILTVLVYAQPYVHPVIVAITSRNAGSVRTRTVASALYNMMVQASNIYGAQIYRTADAPYYYTGNKVLIGICCYSFCLFLFTKWFYIHVNNKRERKWGAMTVEEKQHYLDTTTDEGNKRLDFRFSH